MIRAQLILEDEKIKEKAKTWSLPLIKEKIIDSKITQVISELRLNGKQKKAIVMEIFRYRIGDYVSPDLLASVYRNAPQPELIVRSEIEELNNEMLVDTHNLNIFNFSVYRLIKSDPEGGKWSTPLTLDETKEIFTKLAATSGETDIKKLMEFIKRISNEPFTLSEVSALFEGSNTQETALKAIESLDDLVKDIDIKTSVYILLKKRV